MTRLICNTCVRSGVVRRAYNAYASTLPFDPDHLDGNPRTCHLWIRLRGSTGSSPLPQDVPRCRVSVAPRNGRDGRNSDRFALGFARLNVNDHRSQVTRARHPFVPRATISPRSPLDLRRVSRLNISLDSMTDDAQALDDASAMSG